jgi:hypothetical protein
MRRIFDCIRDSISIAIPQPTEWQRIRSQIDAAMILAWVDFVNVHMESLMASGWIVCRRAVKSDSSAIV